METTNIGKKSRKNEIIYGGVAAVILAGVIGAGLSFAGDGDTLSMAEDSYKLHLQRAEELKAQYELQVSSLCAAEKQLAKAKLSNHYSDLIQLAVDTVGKLTQKTQGESLECERFI